MNKFLIEFCIDSAMYYYNLVNALEAIGYTRNADIKGAPYDWRRAPSKLHNFLYKLKYSSALQR